MSDHPALNDQEHCLVVVELQNSLHYLVYDLYTAN